MYCKELEEPPKCMLVAAAERSMSLAHGPEKPPLNAPERYHLGQTCYKRSFCVQPYASEPAIWHIPCYSTVSSPSVLLFGLVLLADSVCCVEQSQTLAILRNSLIQLFGVPNMEVGNLKP